MHPTTGLCEFMALNHLPITIDDFLLSHPNSTYINPSTPHPRAENTTTTTARKNTIKKHTQQYAEALSLSGFLPSLSISSTLPTAAGAPPPELHHLPLAPAAYHQHHQHHHHFHRQRISLLLLLLLLSSSPSSLLHLNYCYYYYFFLIIILYCYL